MNQSLRIKIGVDFDDVMVDFLAKMVELYNIKHPDNIITKESFITFNVFECPELKYPYSFNDILNSTSHPKSYEGIIVDNYPNDFYADVKPNPGCFEVIKEWLANDFEVFVISDGISFPAQMKSKHDCIKRLFPMIDNNHIIYTKDKSIIAVDIMIDDCEKNLQKTIGRPILFSAYHNRNCNYYPRYNNWGELRLLFSREGV